MAKNEPAETTTTASEGLEMTELDRVVGGAGGVPGMLLPAVQAGGVPGIRMPQVQAGGVPGRERDLGPVSGGGVPGIK